MKLIIKIIIIAGIIFFLYKIVEVKRITEDVEPTGSSEIVTRKTKIKHIAELATATQTIYKAIDTIKFVKDALVIDLYITQITISEKMVENRLKVVYTYKVKAGFRDIEVFRLNPSSFLVEHLKPEVLTFELLSDTTHSETGNWSKMQTDRINNLIRDNAKQSINYDSLYNEATISMQNNINKMIESITGTNNFTVEFQQK